MGSGLLLATTTERCVQLAAVAPQPPSGSARVAVKLHAHKLFAESSLQALVTDGVKFIGLDGESAETGPAPSDANSQMTLLAEGHFPSLIHMSSAVALEMGLGAIQAALPALRANPADRGDAAEYLRAFAKHTFFCFNASTDPNSVLPITSVHEGGSYMLLYTCEMVLEVARITLGDLGGFASAGNQRVPSGPLPASFLVGALTGSCAVNAGIHVNEFVPGMKEGYKLVGLKTADLAALVKAGSDAEGHVV